jgi:hypothetical protein
VNILGTNTTGTTTAAKHTFVNGTDSTSRTDIDGFDTIDFGSGAKSLATAHTIDGVYGQLVWDTTKHSYTYEVYTDSKGDPVRQMIVGQKLTETFTYTVTDKNGEFDTGTTVITIDGKNNGFIVNMENQAVTEGKTEGNILNGSIAEMITKVDAGTVRYAVEYDGTTYNDATSTVYTINTEYGVLTFFPATGAYNFIPNGILQAGESVTLDISVLASLTATGGAAGNQNSGWQNLDLTITGVNDAPETGDAVLHATLGGDNNAHETLGQLSWRDVDNDMTEDFTFKASNTTDGEGSISESTQTIDGKYGTLTLNTEDGQYAYTLDESSMGTAHRVVDEFQWTVTDAGSNAAGDNKATSDASTLTIYGVDGTSKVGTAIGDILNGFNDGKSHVIQGGQGDDSVDLTGSSGENVLVWKAGDAKDGETSTDTILGFDDGANDNFLDVRDLLLDAGVNARESINFEVDGGNTTVNIDLGNGTEQHIVLQGVALNTSDPTGQGNFEELIA